MTYNFDSKGYEKDKPVVVELPEHVTFLNKVSIMKTLNDLPDNSHVIIEASKMKTVHPDVLEIIEDFKLNGETRGVTMENENAN